MKKYILINSLTGGGAEKVVTSLVNNMPSKFAVITIWGGDNNLKNVESYTLLNKHYFMPFDFVFAFFKLMFLINRNKIKTVNSHLFWSNYLNVLVSIFTKHDTFCTHCVAFLSKYKKNSVSFFFHYCLSKRILTHANGHTFKCSDLMLSYKKMFSFKNCSVIYNPVSISDSSLEFIEPLTIDPSCSYLLCVGRFHETKNQADIVKTIPLLDDNIHIVFLGDGPKLSFCKKLANDLNVLERVHFLGHCSNPYPFYKKIPYLISTSKSEGFPNVMIEALFYNCYPIVFDCQTGPREIASCLYTTEKYRNVEYFDIFPLGLVFTSLNESSIAKAINYTLDTKLCVDPEKVNYLLNELNIHSIAKSYYYL